MNLKSIFLIAIIILSVLHINSSLNSAIVSMKYTGSLNYKPSIQTTIYSKILELSDNSGAMFYIFYYPYKMYEFIESMMYKTKSENEIYYTTLKTARHLYISSHSREFAKRELPSAIENLKIPEVRQYLSNYIPNITVDMLLSRINTNPQLSGKTYVFDFGIATYCIDLNNDLTIKEGRCNGILFYVNPLLFYSDKITLVEKGIVPAFSLHEDEKIVIYQYILK